MAPQSLRGQGPATVLVGIVSTSSLRSTGATQDLLRLFPRRADRMGERVQREVADRLGAVAASCDSSRLSVPARLFGSVEPFSFVPRRASCPESEVGPRIVVHRARGGPLPVPGVPRLESAVRLLLFLAARISGTPSLASLESASPRDGSEELEPEGAFPLARELDESRDK